MNQVQIIQVIRTELRMRGTGEPSDPCRIITEFWGLDGEKITEIDPSTITLTPAQCSQLRMFLNEHRPQDNPIEEDGWQFLHNLLSKNTNQKL